MLVHDDATASEDNLDVLRQRIEQAGSWEFYTPWAEEFDTDRMKVRAEGRVLLAKLRRLEQDQKLSG